MSFFTRPSKPVRTQIPTLPRQHTGHPMPASTSPKQIPPSVDTIAEATDVKQAMQSLGDQIQDLHQEIRVLRQNAPNSDTNSHPNLGADLSDDPEIMAEALSFFRTLRTGPHQALHALEQLKQHLSQHVTSAPPTSLPAQTLPIKDQNIDQSSQLDQLIAQALTRWEQQQQATNPDWPHLEETVEQTFIQAITEMPVFTPFEAIMLVNNILEKASEAYHQKAEQREAKQEEVPEQALRPQKSSANPLPAKVFHNTYPDQGAGRAQKPKPKSPRAAFEAALSKIEAHSV